jgi:hypothetical protein
MDDLAYLLGTGLSEQQARRTLRALFSGMSASGLNRDDLAEVSDEKLAEVVGAEHAEAVARLLDAER